MNNDEPKNEGIISEKSGGILIASYVSPPLFELKPDVSITTGYAIDSELKPITDLITDSSKPQT